MRIALLVCFAALAACGNDSAAPRDHDDDTGDGDCVMDTCGVCDGDGASCAPEAEITIVLEVEGATLGVFPFVKGLGSANELVIVNQNEVIPGKLQPGNVTLIRQVGEGLELTQWREAIEGGAASTQTVRLTLNDSVLGVIARWELANAWPSSLDVASSAAELRETIVITHDGGSRLAP